MENIFELILHLLQQGQGHLKNLAVAAKISFQEIILPNLEKNMSSLTIRNSAGSTFYLSIRYTQMNWLSGILKFLDLLFYSYRLIF